MRVNLFILSILIASFLYLPQALSEYNLATGQEEYLLVSSKKEVQIGKSISKQVEKKMDLDKNYTNQERVGVIGEKLAQVCDRRDFVYTFRVLDKEDTENAFALPGGYVYIFKALLEKLTDEELAAVLAHEIGHICARHSTKRLQKGLGYQVLAVLVAARAADSYTRYKANEAFAQLMLANSREDEFEADRLSVKYLERAGYDPEAVVSMLDKMIKWQMEEPTTTPKRYWYTHPYLAARRSAANQEIAGQMSFDDYMNITDDEEYIVPR